MLYALLHKNTVIGLFNDIKKCEMMSKGLVNNKFTQSKFLSIVSYYDNSITLYDQDLEKEDEVEHNIEEFSNEETSDSVNTESLNSDTQKKIKKQRDKQSKIEYNMTLLKKKKEQIEENKNVYKTDYELYKRLKKIAKDNTEFIIPELFQVKYKTMDELENANNLSWDTFSEVYKKTDITTSYDRLFGDCKSPDRKLLNIESDTPNDTSASEEQTLGV